MRSVSGSFSSCVFVLASCVLPVGAALLVAEPAAAQSATDRATARQLATEGIKLYDGGQYAAALEKLERAESLYDAPVHLLYIARNQTKLGKLIEGAETYRRLVRVQLEANAPPVFVEAKESGETELSALEPRIPTLRISVEPAGVAELNVKVGTESVPVAALGVDRPVNPGSLEITASAPGYRPAQAVLKVAEGEQKSLALKLDPSGEPIPAAGAAPTEGPADGGAAAPAASDEAKPPSKVGFLLGLRFGGAFPSGTLAVGPTGADFPVGDYAKTGGGGELHAGVRFLKYFTVAGYVGGYRLSTGNVLEKSIADVPGATASTQAVDLFEGGIKALVGTPRGTLGGFGELGFTLVQNLNITRDITGSGLAACKVTESLTGPAFRLGAGMNLPVANFFHLTPYLNVEFGSFSGHDFKNNCSVDPLLNGLSSTISGSSTAAHQLILVGIGGDFLLGRDKEPE